MRKNRVLNRYMTTPTIINKTMTNNLNKKQTDQPINMINIYMKKLVRSDTDRINANLNRGIGLLSEGAYYYPHCVCSEKDLTLFTQILMELEKADEFKLIEWSKHYKVENPKFSQTFNQLIEKVAKIFNLSVCETRLNYYKDHNDWKPLHHDSHAYSNMVREDFTIGISIGGSRELSFVHENSGNGFKFPQKNGDVFAFDSNVNKEFLHGITKGSHNSAPRLSLIAWCKQMS